MTEIFKYVVRRSDYNLAVIYNLIDSLLPPVNAEWAKGLTKVLREQIIVSRIAQYAAQSLGKLTRTF